MLPAQSSFAWRFGGPLADLPPTVAWTVLLVVCVLGAALVFLSYRRTLAALAPAPRRLLVSLRLSLWIFLILALAGPARVERTYAQNQTRPLAVLVDQSGSMTTPDNRRQRRLDDSLRRWRALAPAAENAHPVLRTFAFADTATPAALSAIDAPAALPAGQTRLFASLDQLLASAPAGGWGGVLTLTDGLDTATPDLSAALAATSRAALASGTPLYFLPGRNRYSGGDLLSFREIDLPARVPPRSTFRLELTLDTFQQAGRDLPLHLKVGDSWRAPETLRLESGRRAIAWNIDLAADSPGLLPLQLRAGDGPDAAVLRAEVRVAPPDSTRILYYQGALDWGYRFLADILRRDPGFTLSPIFNLASSDPASARRHPPASSSGLRLPSSGSPSVPLTTLPATAAGLADYDIVVLANTAAEHISSAQQSALSTWVRDGGVLVFLTPDDTATHGFAGTELEKMLPVTFERAAASARTDAEIANFRAEMKRQGGANIHLERDFADRSARATRRPPLASFSWEPKAASLLGAELVEAAPRFAHFARVRSAKPGAEVLARHPTAFQAGSSDRAILLALQRYGRGQSAVLASDALWRWKLHQPSHERGVEKFWQNLFSWLARERVRGVRFDRPPLQAERGREIALRIAGAPAGLVLTARPLPADAAANETAAPATPLLISSIDATGARVFTWTASREGVWEFSARAGDGPPVRHWITVAPAATGETSGLPADENLLRSLAERTGGAVLADSPPASWLAPRDAAPELLREVAAPLWHHAWLFVLLLALYLAELLLRRKHRLL